MTEPYPYARQVIDIVGGAIRTAAIIGRNRFTVHKFTYPIGKSGGYGGMIPMADAIKLLEHGEATGDYFLTPQDFFKLRHVPQEDGS